MKLSRRSRATIVFLVALGYLAISNFIQESSEAGVDDYVSFIIIFVAFGIGMKETIAQLKKTLIGKTDDGDR